MLRYKNGNDAALRREFGEFGVETPSSPSELREQCFLTGAPSSSSSWGRISAIDLPFTSSLYFLASLGLSRPHHPSPSSVYRAHDI